MNLAIKGFSNDVDLLGKSSFFLLIEVGPDTVRLPVPEETVTALLQKVHSAPTKVKEAQRIAPAPSSPSLRIEAALAEEDEPEVFGGDHPADADEEDELSEDQYEPHQYAGDEAPESEEKIPSL